MAQSCASVVCSSGTGTGSFLSQSETFLLPVSRALTAGVDGGFDLKGELHGGHSFWQEESVQFQNHQMKGELGHSGKRSRSSLRCWQENTEQFHEGVSHEPETKGEMIGSRRRRRRGGCIAEARSVSDLDVSHSFDLSSVRVESPLSRVQRVTAAMHVTHIIHRIHTACMVLVVF